MVDTPDEHESLSERFFDLFVFLPTGLAVTLAEELPRLAERGRERLGVQVNSARAVGRFTVKAGHHELKKRSESLKRPTAAASGTSAPGATTRSTAGGTPPSGPPRLRAIPRPPPPGSTSTAPQPAAPATTAAPPVPAAPTAPSAEREPSPPSAARTAGSSDGHIPEVASLAIPGFDTLSASQVVQRLDGLSRSELVAVRAYETSGRGRRTILSRVDQLLDERS